MNFIYEEDRIFLQDENKKVIAEVNFPAIDEQTVNIRRTFVDDSLRGQGVAGKLLEAAAVYLAEQNKKVVPTCSYAVKWFEKHPEYERIVDKK